jgi:hypothetical protein
MTPRKMKKSKKRYRKSKYRTSRYAGTPDEPDAGEQDMQVEDEPEGKQNTF